MMLLPAFGALQQGASDAEYQLGQASAHEYNAKVADINKAAAYSQGSAAEEANRRDSRQALGEQRAAIAESGTGFGGTNAAIAKQSTTNAELDALNIRYGAALEATGYENQSKSERFNAKLAKRAAKRARTAGYLNATGALVDSVSNVVSYAGGLG